MTGIYVDDGLNAETSALEQLTDTTMKQYAVKERIYDNFGFFGVHIITTADWSFQMH